MPTNTSDSPMIDTNKASDQAINPSNENPNTADESRDSTLKVLVAQGEVFSQEVRRGFASFKDITAEEGSAELGKTATMAEPIFSCKMPEVEKENFSVALGAMEMKQTIEGLAGLADRYNATHEAVNGSNAGVGSDKSESTTPLDDADGVSGSTETDTPSFTINSGNSVLPAPSEKEGEERIPWDGLSNEDVKVLRRRFGLQNLKDGFENGFTKEELAFLTREQIPYVWKMLSLEDQLEQMQMVLPSEGVLCALLPCGGKVYIDLETANTWHDEIPVGVHVILGNYGVAYGKLLAGHTIARAPHKSNLMNFVTWDKMYFMAPGNNWFSPILLNPSFLHYLGDPSTGSSLFSRYVANELVLAYEEGNFEAVYGIAGLDPEKDAPVMGQQENDLDVDDFFGDGTIEIDRVELAKKENQQDLLTETSCLDGNTAEKSVANQEDTGKAEGPATGQEGTGKVEEPVTGQEGTVQAEKPAVDQEDKATSPSKRHYSMEQDPESLEKRVDAAKKESEILGLDEESVPSPEELKEMDDSISKQKRHDFVDPVTLIAAVMEALRKAILTTLTHNELFIDPKTEEPSPTGFNPKGGISFEEAVRFMMSGLNGESTQTAIVSFFGNDMNAKTIWNSRSQISEECMKFLFSEFNRNLIASKDLAPIFSEKLFGKYHAFGIDGSCINLPLNKGDEDTYCPPTKGKSKGYNQLHGVFFIGLFSGIYHDVVLNSKKKTAERATLLDIVKNNEYLKVLEERGEKFLIEADRGFESWEVFAKLSMLGINFIIRIKDSKSGGILKSFDLKAYDQFEIGVNVVFHAKGLKKKATANAKYAAFLDEETAVLELSLRVLQFRLQKGGKLEALITNIPMSDLTALQLEYLYSLRWREEVSFRTLKYQINLRYNHSKRPLFVRQELWAKLTMFNFASVIFSHIKVPEAKWSKGRKHEYAIKKAHGIALCFRLLAGTMSVQTVARRILMNLQPIRPDRTFKRNVKPQSNIGFNYRAVG